MGTVTKLVSKYTLLRSRNATEPYPKFYNAIKKIYQAGNNVRTLASTALLGLVDAKSSLEWHTDLPAPKRHNYVLTSIPQLGL